MNKRIITILTIVLSLGAGSALSAQEEGDAPKAKAKSGFTLPTAGDIQLGVDVAPILRYVGNMFNGNTNNSLNNFGGEWVVAPEQFLKEYNPVFDPTVSIMGKYMITDNVAARANIGIMTLHENNRAYSIDDAAYALNNMSEAKVIDSYRANHSGAAFSLGAEYRRGYRWIQGIFGADVIYGFSTANRHYTYGNAVTELNQNPSRAYGLTTEVPGYWSNGRGYILDYYNTGVNHHVGLDIRVGVECFMTSYLALGGEVSLTALWNVGAHEYMVTEGFNTLTNSVEQRTELVSPGSTSFTFGTRNLGGKLYLAFYF